MATLRRVPDFRSRMQHFITIDNIHVYTMADEDILILKLHANRKKDRVDLDFLFEHNPEVLQKVKQLLRLYQHEDLIQRIEEINAMRPLGEGRTPWA